MAESYEREVGKKIENGEGTPEKIKYSILKYFWDSNPLIRSQGDTIPKFLRSVDVLTNFTDLELRTLSKYLNERKFSDREIIFKQNDYGMGLYFIFRGHVDLYVNKNDEETTLIEKESISHLLTLGANDYFGELSLLQENSIRNASAVARDGCVLLGIFKPDLEEMINLYPVVAAKLLQAISVIIASRFFSLSKETKELKVKLAALEKEAR